MRVTLLDYDLDVFRAGVNQSKVTRDTSFLLNDAAKRLNSNTHTNNTSVVL